MSLGRKSARLRFGWIGNQPNRDVVRLIEVFHIGNPPHDCVQVADSPDVLA